MSASDRCSKNEALDHRRQPSDRSRRGAREACFSGKRIARSLAFAARRRGCRRGADSFHLQSRGGCGDGQRCRRDYAIPRRIPQYGSAMACALSLSLQRRRSVASPVSSGRQPRFDGGGRAADSRTVEGRLSGRQRFRMSQRTSRKRAFTGLQHRQARSYGDRNRAVRCIGELRGSGVGARNLRIVEGPPGAVDRCGQDVRTRGPASQPISLSPIAHARAPRIWPRCSRAV